MFELFKVIREYHQKRKLKKLLKKRIVKMPNNKLNLNDGQYIVNGTVKSDTEIVDEITKWSVENFVFRNNDVYLPNVPMPLFGPTNMIKHEDLQVDNFISKYGNLAIKYLLYNAFIVGYEAGLARGENDSIEKLEKVIEEVSDASVAKEEAKEGPEVITKVDNTQPTDTVTKVINTEERDEEILEETKVVQRRKLEKKPSMKEIEEFKQQEITEEQPVEDEVVLYDKAHFDGDKLLIDSNLYKTGTYEKYISMVIEDKLSKYGMTIDDIESKGFPSYILGEVLLDVSNADTVNVKQKKVKKQFYDYLKGIHESITKINTSV